MLDLFAGTGALGLEALSRGADFVDFVEDAIRTIGTLEANIASLGANDRCAVHRDDAVRFVGRLPRHDGRMPYDVAFADPPYRKGLALAVAECWLATPFAAIFGIEHEASLELPGAHDVRRYGDTAITLYRS